MRKKFIVNLLFLIGVNLLVKPLWMFGIDRTVQLQLGYHAYGLYYVLFNFSYLFTMLLDFGLANYNTTHISRNNNLLHSLVPNLAALKLFLSIIYLLITLSVALIFQFETSHLRLLLLLCISQVFNSFTLYFRSFISAMQHFIVDSLLSVSDKILMIIVCALLIWTHVLPYKLSITSFIAAQTVSYLTSAILALLALLYYGGKIPLQFNFKKVVVLLKDVFPYALLGLLMAIYSRSDSILLERLLPDGTQQAGIYASAYRLIDMLGMFAFLFATLLLPIFSSQIHQKQKIEPLMVLSVKILLSFAFILCMLITAFAIPLMETLYPQKDISGILVMQISIWSFLGIAAMYLFGTLLLANQNIKTLLWICFPGLILNIGLNVILIPLYGARGAALSAAITQVAIASLQYYFCHRYFNWSLEWKTIGAILSFATLSGLTIVSSQYLPWPWYINGGIAVLLAGGQLFITGLITFSDFTKFTTFVLRKSD